LLCRVVLLLGEVRRGCSWHFGMRKRVGRFYPKGKYSSMVWCYGYVGGRKLTWRKWREGTYSTEWICGECWSCWQEGYVGILVFYWKKRRDRHEAAHLFSYSVFCFAIFCFSVGVLISEISSTDQHCRWTSFQQTASSPPTSARKKKGGCYRRRDITGYGLY